MKIKDVTCIQPLKKHINKMRKFDPPHRNTSTVHGINSYPYKRTNDASISFLNMCYRNDKDLGKPRSLKYRKISSISIL